MLLICGNPCELLETALQKQWLPPSGAAVSLPESACNALRNGTAPTPGQLAAAAETGQLPYRPADTVLGDLLGGSGITALHTAENGHLTLSLWDRQQQYGTISVNACRGLALLGNRWKTFSFACADGVCRVRRAVLHTAVTEQDGAFCVTVSGTVTAETDDPAAAEHSVTEMLSAALHETARDAGADLLFLREYAIRSGVTEARFCSQAQWRDMLRHAECSISLHQQNISKHENSVY